MFASDRDLLMYEPRLFLDTVWVGQRQVSASGIVVSGVLVVSGVTFMTIGIGAGQVVTYKDAAYEVVQVLGETQLGLSLPRASADDPVILAPDSASTTVQIYTFRHQLLIVHEQILRMIGIEPDVEAEPGESIVSESSIINPTALRRLEALGALHLIYAAASVAGPLGEGSVYADKAAMYRERFAAERERVNVLIDTDGDGRADAARRPTVMHLVRG
ncbi:MAG: hypothetical protein KDA31_14070 [Phycisphaerales bacterium]|nr:hypothetical protein [Phycisphaerales bacterium]MCB9836068.1 hypothetical protein [Phycisphaera sp.]